MKKYNTEGDIDFYSELMSGEGSSDQQDYSDNTCLITHDKLSDKHVTMTCGHKFNYVPLYNDILNHKTKFNIMESNVGSLRVNEYRCPYCRYKQSGVLPYYPELGLSKVNGINCIVPHLLTGSKEVEQCCFTTVNLYYDPDIPDDIYNVQNIKCFSYGSQINVDGIDYGDKNSYCGCHKNTMIKKHKKEATVKLKEDNKQALLLKKKCLADEKAKARLNNKLGNISKHENVVITPEQQPYNACVEILKTGANKGTGCKCIVFEQNLCRRHYNIHNKKDIITI